MGLVQTNGVLTPLAELLTKQSAFPEKLQSDISMPAQNLTLLESIKGTVSDGRRYMFTPSIDTTQSLAIIIHFKLCDQNTASCAKASYISSTLLLCWHFGQILNLLLSDTTRPMNAEKQNSGSFQIDLQWTCVSDQYEGNSDVDANRFKCMCDYDQNDCHVSTCQNWLDDCSHEACDNCENWTGW